MTLQTAIYIYDEVEVLDFAGPFQALTTANRMHLRNQPGTPEPFAVYLVAESDKMVQARGGFPVQPHHTIASHPPFDLLIVPGGAHTGELKKANVIQWLRAQHARTQLTASICTGAFLLAKAGILEGFPVTTHWEDIADLRAEFPRLTVREDARWFEHERIMTSAGISAGIDMSLRIVARFCGDILADRTARQMDYAWRKTPWVEDSRARATSSRVHRSATTRGRRGDCATGRGRADSGATGIANCARRVRAAPAWIVRSNRETRRLVKIAGGHAGQNSRRARRRDPGGARRRDETVQPRSGSGAGSGPRRRCDLSVDRLPGLRCAACARARSRSLAAT